MDQFATQNLVNKNNELIDYAINSLALNIFRATSEPNPKIGHVGTSIVHAEVYTQLEVLNHDNPIFRKLTRQARFRLALMKKYHSHQNWLKDFSYYIPGSEKRKEKPFEDTDFAKKLNRILNLSYDTITTRKCDEKNWLSY